MLIFRIEQSENDGYDTYDMAIVVACDEAHAKRIHPSGYGRVWCDRSDSWKEADGTWASLTGWAFSPDGVTAQRVGMVTGGVAKPGEVICASFNAG